MTRWMRMMRLETRVSRDRKLTSSMVEKTRVLGACSQYYILVIT